MARFYFHLYESAGFIADEEGLELADLDRAHKAAITGARSIIAHEAEAGRLDLTGRLEVTDADGRVVLTLPFNEAVEVKL